VTATSGWEPHTDVDDVLVAAEPIHALQALLDDGLPFVDHGDRLPPLWHWVALATWSRSAALGVDGHPRRGSFLPPVELPRRMFAGGDVVFTAPLTVGGTVRRESSVTGVTEKQGRSGRLVFVDVTVRLYDGDVLALTEVQHLVYRGAETRASRDGHVSLEETMQTPPVGRPLTRIADWHWQLATDPTVLMRFSAATANAHRIHYDWPYATQVEGYPGLVVHGPLLSLALAEVARLEGVSGITRIVHRNLAPLFCGSRADLGLAPPAEENRDAGGSTTLHLVSDEVPRTSLTFWSTTERQLP
jgi:3-methylfumaryl-CoA hydratase